MLTDRTSLDGKSRSRIFIYDQHDETLQKFIFEKKGILKILQEEGEEEKVLKLGLIEWNSNELTQK